MLVIVGARRVQHVRDPNYLTDGASRRAKCFAYAVIINFIDTNGGREQADVRVLSRLVLSCVALLSPSLSLARAP